MSDAQSVAALLQQTLTAATANKADRELRSIETSPGFPIILLSLVDSPAIDNATRLAAALFFKNFLNRRWVDADGAHKLALADVESIKTKIVALMIHLDNNNLKKQIGESISIIADSDFPHKWTNLVDELVANLNTTDLNNVNGVLSVAHSIFKRWRPLFRSDELFLEIKFVLDKFTQPFMNLLIETDKSIQANSTNKETLFGLFENLLLLIKIYYDFNCQDVPEFFEDNIKPLMEIMHRYFVFKSDLLTDKDEDDEVDILSKVKGSICDLIQLYSTRYEDVFDPLIQKFVQSAWDELTSLTLQVKYDILTAKCLTFLTSVIKIPKYFDIFNNDQVLNDVFVKIILPNITLRESDEELFEDDPIEYIKRDIENNDFNSRRSSATGFLRELKDKNESLVTEIVMKYVNQFLQNYKQDSSQWKAKDTAIYLFIAVAAKGNITNAGITSTNLLVDIIGFFQQNIAAELVSSTANPILIVDSIKYLNIFRNQLTKQQLVESFPLLLTHLNSNSYIIYTYSAITIEKIFSLRDTVSANHSLLFSKSDIEPIFKELVTTLFKRITPQDLRVAPEKLAENDYLVKCLMRVLILNNDNLTKSPDSFEFVGLMTNQLIEIITIISRNPSNPRFSHYCFESVGIIINFNYAHKPEYVLNFMDLVFPKFFAILGEGVVEFVPYIIQIFAFLLELLQKSCQEQGKTMELPEYHKNIIKPLLSPSLWEFKGNIPPITRLLIDIIEFDKTSFNDNLIPLLGVFQKLMSSKVNDVHGFELLEAILVNIDLQLLKPYLTQIANVIFTRLQNSRTTKLIKRLIVFFSIISLIDETYVAKRKSTNVLGPDFAVQFVDQLQEGLFGNIYKSFFLPNLASFNNLNDKKILTVGLTSLLTKNSKFVSGPYAMYFIDSINELYKLTVNRSELFGTAGSAVAGVSTEDDMLTEFELEEFTFGSTYSKLVIVGNKRFDPISDVSNHDIKPAFLAILKAFGTANSDVFMSSIYGQLDSLLQNELNSQ